MENKQKYNEIQLMRIIGAVAVIFQHSIAVYLYKPEASLKFTTVFAALLTLSRFAVVLFMVISGFVMIKSYRNIKYLDFLRHKFLKLFLMYIGWSLFFILFRITCIHESFTFMDVVKHLFWGDSLYHTWYLVLVIKVYLFFPIIRKIVDKVIMSKHKVISVIILTLIEIALLYWSGNGAFDIYYGTSNLTIKTILEYRDRSLILWAYYFIIGGISSYYIEEIRAFIKSNLTKIVCFTIAGYALISYYVFIGLTDGNGINFAVSSPLNLKVFIYDLMSIVCIYYICYRLVKKGRDRIKRISSAGKYTFKMYIIHPVIIYFVSNALDGMNFIALPIKAIILIIVTISLSYILAYIIDNIKNISFKKAIDKTYGA